MLTGLYYPVIVSRTSYLVCMQWDCSLSLKVGIKNIIVVFWNPLQMIAYMSVRALYYLDQSLVWF